MKIKLNTAITVLVVTVILAGAIIFTGFKSNENYFMGRSHFDVMLEFADQVSEEEIRDVIDGDGILLIKKGIFHTTLIFHEYEVTGVRSKIF